MDILFSNLNSTGNAFIDECWSIESGQESLDNIKFIPDGLCHLTIPISRNIEIQTNSDHFIVSQCMISGQFSRAFDFSIKPETNLIRVGFKPTALYRLFGLNMSDLTDDFVPFQDVVGQLPYVLLDLITAEHDMDKRISIITDFFSNTKPLKVNTLVDDCIIKIQALQGNIKILELTKSHGLSAKYLEERFKKEIGITPGKYAKIIRFFSVVKEIKMNQTPMSDIAAAYHYYDTSHLAKDFKLFTGLGPREFLKNHTHWMDYLR